MWLFTPYGFFSVVRKPRYSDLRTRFDAQGNATREARPNLYQIRSRDASHLETLRKRFRIRAKVETGGGTDYAYRVCVSKRVWSRIGPLMVAASEIEYGNFKSEVAKRLGCCDYEYALHEVWRAMQRKRPQPRPRVDEPRYTFSTDRYSDGIAFGPFGGGR